MKLSHAVWSLVAAVLIFGPVGWRVLTWQRPQPPVVDEDLVKAGSMLFNHEWQVNDPLSPEGDGLGPVFNARSCVACHDQGGVGGGGGVEHNVTTFLVLSDDGTPLRQGVVHAFATQEAYQENLTQVDPSLPAIAQPKLEQLVSSPQAVGTRRGGNLLAAIAGSLRLPQHVKLSQRNTPALFGAGLIDLLPDQVIIANERRQRLRHGLASSASETVPVGRIHRLANGKIGRFGWKAQMGSLSEFVEAACANELGLGNPKQSQPASMAQLAYSPRGLDLSQKQCDQLTAFVAALPRPVERQPADAHLQKGAHAGSALFTKIGCAECHAPNLGNVQGIFSDLLLHRMGQELESGDLGYGSQTPPPAPTPTHKKDNSVATEPLPDEWRTPPLWGVADSAPYMHDGRAATLADAITQHGGQGAAAAHRFRGLPGPEQAQVLAFLSTLRAP